MADRKLVKFACLALVVSLLAPNVARGDAKDARKQVSIKIKERERTKKLAPKVKDSAEDRPDVRITADDFLNIETAQQDINEELIAEYGEAIIEAQDADLSDPTNLERVAEFMFRLAEAYAHKQRFFHSMAMETEFKIGNEKNKSKKADLIRKRQGLEKAEKDALLMAEKAYTAIVRDERFKAYPRMDEVIFYLAYTLQQAKRPDEARRAYVRLTREYPQSKYIADAYLSLADAYFNESNLNDAETFYDKVLKYPKAPAYYYALYKKGWVQYNRTNFKGAFQSWLDVADKTNTRKKDAQLNRASKKDLVRAYAEFGAEDKAFDVFKRTDEKYAPTMYETLGRLYLDDQGKFPKAIYVFRDMIERFPDNTKVCEWQNNVVQATISISSTPPEGRYKEFERFAKLYTYLRENKVLKENLLDECRENAAGVVQEWAVFLHMEAVKTLNQDTLKHAVALYGLYLKYFSEADDTAFMHFLYAELLWSLAAGEKQKNLQPERWRDAAEASSKFVALKETMPKSVEAAMPLIRQAIPDLGDRDPLAEAAYASVLAWQKALSIETATESVQTEEQADVKKCTRPEPLAITENEKKMISAFDVYIKYITDPKDKNLVEIKFFKARIYWRTRHFDEAVELFDDLLTKHRGHDTSEFAANLILDSLNRSCRFKDLTKWATKILELDGGKFVADKDVLRQTSEGIKRTSMRMAAQQLEADGQYFECGSAYVNIFQTYPEGEDTHEIIFNAGVCYEKAKAFQNAITMREYLVVNFPDKKEAKMSLFALGANYSAIAEYGTAAAYYEKYAKAFTGEKDAASAMGNAVFFYKGVGNARRRPRCALDGSDKSNGKQICTAESEGGAAAAKIKDISIDGDDKAVESTKWFVDKFSTKSKDDAAGASYSLVTIYEKQKREGDVIRHLKEYLAKFPKGGVDRAIMANAKIGEILWRQSCPVKGVNGACLELTRARAVRSTATKKKGGVARTQCGAADKLKTLPFERKASLAADARKHFSAAIALWKKGDASSEIVTKDEGERAARTAEMNKYAAAAHFYMAEADYEKTLRIPFPKDLDFDPKKEKKAKESEKKFVKWIEERGNSIKLAKEQYMYIVTKIRGGGAGWAIASATRVGQMTQQYAGAIFTAEIPKDVFQYGEEGVDAYCDKLGEESSKVEEQALKAYDFCLGTALELNWFNEWSQLCESELSQIRPLDYPPADELRGTPTLEPRTTTFQPILTELAK